MKFLKSFKFELFALNWVEDNIPQYYISISVQQEAHLSAEQK